MTLLILSLKGQVLVVTDACGCVLFLLKFSFSGWFSISLPIMKLTGKKKFLALIWISLPFLLGLTHIFSMFWSGDTNLQPAALGKGADCKPSRDRRWEALVKKWSVFLWNPTAFGGQPYSLFLPRRKKTMSLVPSNTHHYNGGPGASRTLDLIYGSSELIGCVLIHNALHCKAAGCDWDNCLEFIGSDYFLLEIIFENIYVRLGQAAGMKLPAQWHEPCLWEHGLTKGSKILLGLSELVLIVQRCI